MNYMEQVAKMIGVELEEKVDLIYNGEISGTFYITKAGELVYYAKNRELWDGRDALLGILRGELTIKKKPWKPQYGGKYFWVRKNGKVDDYSQNNDNIDQMLYKIGNCYRTREEAEAHAEEWKAWYESDEQVDVLGEFNAKAKTEIQN